MLQAKVEELNSLWQSTKDQLEVLANRLLRIVIYLIFFFSAQEKMSESSVVNKSTTPRRWAAVSFEVTLALISLTHLSMYFEASVHVCTKKSHVAFSGVCI